MPNLNLISLYRNLKQSPYEDFLRSLTVGNTKIIPKYKFFSEIVQSLLQYKIKYGVNPHQAVREIRKASVTERSQFLKVKQLIYGGYYQYFFLASFIWFYFYHFKLTLGASGPTNTMYFIFIWQLLGLASLSALGYFIHKKLFSPFYYFFYSAYMLRALLQISRPVSEVLCSAKLHHLDKYKEFKSQKERIYLLIQELKLRGQIPMDEWDYLIQELWDHFELNLIKFNKQLQILKLISLTVFILPSFLYLMFSSISQMGF